jgi:hypothetical protein
MFFSISGLLLLLIFLFLVVFPAYVIIRAGRQLGTKIGEEVVEGLKSCAQEVADDRETGLPDY